MRLPSVILPLTLVLAGMAGCASPASTEPPPEEELPQPVVASIPWGLTNCRTVVLVVPVNAAAVEAYMPPNFTLRVGGGPVPGQTSVGFGLEAFECASGAGLNGTVETMAYASYWIGADPPAEYELGEDRATFVKWDTLVPDSERRHALAAWGLPARDGAASAGWMDASGGQRLVTASMDLDGGEGFTFAGFGGQQADDEGFRFVEYMVAEDGAIVVWRGLTSTATQVYSGQGRVELSPGWARDVVGADSAVAQFRAAMWTFSEGSVAPVDPHGGAMPSNGAP